MRLQREKWSFRSLDEVHQAANVVFRFAMFNERSKRWPKVAEAYKRLLWLVDKSHLPKEYEPPSSYAILMYELHYHLAVALQRLGQHRKAITHFSKAIESVSIPKGGCLAGCVGNSCLMTPVLARRAFAYVKVGDMRSALRDAENAVVLDSKNPDVYCIRALVRGSRDEENLAVKDVDEGLKLNPSHVCALIIRGALSRTLRGVIRWPNRAAELVATIAPRYTYPEYFSPSMFGKTDTHGCGVYEAERLNPESQSYYTVTDFNHPHMLDFYDRFLFTLSVPHTITEINLTPDKPSKHQLDSNPELYSRTSSRSGAYPIRPPTEPFRCGTPASGDNKSAARRRRDYGEAVRKFMARPKTATEFLAQLERERAKRHALEQSQQRATSAVGPSTRSSPDGRTLTTSPFSLKSTLPSPVLGGKTSHSPTFLSPNQMPDKASDRTSFRSEGSSPKPSVRLDLETKTQSGRTTRTSCTKAFTYETPTNYSIPVSEYKTITVS
ncbi:hypothetical protein BaRGS_00027852 [Batillaria attramentaria]|uniref:Uncharacterized protein n=1 Tax=Batillaria attramentaria TaxID=370345 RepID=A0ABD0K1R2_9CAEN